MFRLLSVALLVSKCYIVAWGLRSIITVRTGTSSHTVFGAPRIYLSALLSIGLPDFSSSLYHTLQQDSP